MKTWDDVAERDEEFYLSAFWIGFDAGQKVERSVIELESMWRLEREIQTIKEEDAHSNSVARQPKEDGGRDRQVAPEIRGTISPDKGAREPLTEERFREIIRGVIKVLER